MANLITGCRIICSIALLFVPPLSAHFYGLYLLAGFSDMIDGTVARKMNTANEFGSKLDTAADMIFVAACFIRLLPVVQIPLWLGIWIVVIAVIKLMNLAVGYVRQHRMAAVHTIINKVTGALLFLLPFTLGRVDLKYSGSVICVVATAAALWEGCLIWKATD